MFYVAIETTHWKNNRKMRLSVSKVCIVFFCIVSISIFWCFNWFLIIYMLFLTLNGCGLLFSLLRGSISTILRWTTSILLFPRCWKSLIPLSSQSNVLFIVSDKIKVRCVLSIIKGFHVHISFSLLTKQEHSNSSWRYLPEKLETIDKLLPQ